MALKPHQIRFVAGDTLPSLRGTLTEDDGSAVNLAGSTVALHIKYDTPLVKTAVIVSAIEGKWLVTWDPTDLVAGRKWNYEIQVTDSSGGIRTWNRENVSDKLLEMVIDVGVV